MVHRVRVHNGGNNMAADSRQQAAGSRELTVLISLMASTRQESELEEEAFKAHLQ